MPERPTMCFRVGTLEHTEAEIKTWAINRPTNHAYVTEPSCWKYCVKCHTSVWGRSHVLTLQGRGKGTACIEPSHALPYANFNLYPFFVINYNHEDNSFQWALQSLLANYENMWFWGTPKLNLMSEMKMVLKTKPSNTTSGRETISDTTISNISSTYLKHFNHDFLLSAPQHTVLICLVIAVALKSGQYCPSQNIWQCLDIFSCLNEALFSASTE